MGEFPDIEPAGSTTPTGRTPDPWSSSVKRWPAFLGQRPTAWSRRQRTVFHDGRHPGTWLPRNLVAKPDDPPGFREFAWESGLPFEPSDDFTLANIEAREELYQELGQGIWSMDAIREAGNG